MFYFFYIIIEKIQLHSALQRVNKYVEASQSITDLEEQLRLNKQPKVNWLFSELSKRLEDGGKLRRNYLYI